MKDYIRIQPEDNVVVLTKALNKGSIITVDNEEVCLKTDVPAGHKVAVTDIMKGCDVIKYSECIGHSTEIIPKGSHVHTHNIATNLNQAREYSYSPKHAVKTSVPPGLKDNFMGYRRFDNRVGVRNEIWIVPTVGCVNSIASKLADIAQSMIAGNVDAVVAFPHPYGCSQMDNDQENTRKILADIIKHPNAGGVLVLGLGCENSSIGVLKPYLGSFDESRVRFLVCQDCEDEFEEGLSLLKELIDTASKDERSECSVSSLTIGLKCGGSDGFSGITANPLVGTFSDLLIAKGGTAILTEVPEMFGAETLLMDRCIDESLFKKTVCLINDFKDYYIKNGQTIYENPSPGNKAGGISTLEDKSLGCTQKSGSSPVTDVLSYGETSTISGLNLLSAPGNDLVATTALAASGAQIVLFTTGRGTPFGSVVPTVKISSNTALFAKKRNWIDFDAGVLLESNKPDDIAVSLYNYVLSVAGGTSVCAEKAGYHDMAIFKNGVTL